MNVIEILQERGFIENMTHEDELYEYLNNGSASCYIGFDPTASSLHVGSLVPIMSLAHMQRNGHRPIAPEKMEVIDEKLTIEWTYNSNAIEGNTLSLKETAFFLKRGLTLKGKSLVEHLEAQNHAEAIAFLKDVAASG